MSRPVAFPLLLQMMKKLLQVVTLMFLQLLEIEIFKKQKQQLILFMVFISMNMVFHLSKFYFIWDNGNNLLQINQFKTLLLLDWKRKGNLLFWFLQSQEISLPKTVNYQLDNLLGENSEEVVSILAEEEKCACQLVKTQISFFSIATSKQESTHLCRNKIIWITQLPKNFCKLK